MRRPAALLLLAAVAACSRTGTGAGVRADITAQMQSIQSPIAACYADSLKANRKLKGMMVVNFRAASGSGQFEDVNIGRNEVVDATLGRCVVELVGKLKLQTPQRTSAAVAYPIRFTPSN